MLIVGSPSCSEVQNSHNERLEDKTCVLSESSLLVFDSISAFRDVDHMASKQRAAGDTKLENSSSNCDSAVETKSPRCDQAASLESQSMETSKKLVSNRTVNSILPVIMRPNLTCSSVTSCQAL